MGYGKLWWVEKTARIQAARGKEVTPLRATIGKVEPEIGGAKTAIRGGDRTLGSGHAFARACRYINDDAGLLTILSGWRTGDDLQRFDALVSGSLDFRQIDRAPEDVLNRILWRAMKGSQVAYPEWAITAGAKEDEEEAEKLERLKR